MNPDSQEKIVEIAYALPEQQVIIPVKLTEGMTAEIAIKQSGILDKFPEIDLEVNKIDSKDNPPIPMFCRCQKTQQWQELLNCSTR